MLQQPIYAENDVQEIRALIADRGWATLVSTRTDGELFASHLPIILDGDADDATILGHLARPDAKSHELGTHDVLLVVEGPNGYVSPDFYSGGPYVPTWNFAVVHLYGEPEILPRDETYSVLDATVDHFEAGRPKPWSMSSVQEYAHRIAPGVTGFRLKPRKVIAKTKMSQEKPYEDVIGVIRGLSRPTDPHHNPAVAAMMQHLSTGPAAATDPRPE